MKFQLTENINKPLRLVEDAKDDMINVLRQELQAHGIPDPTNGNQPQNNLIDIQNAKNILIDFSKKIKLKANLFIKAGVDPNDLEKIAGKNLTDGYSFRLKGDSLALVYTSGWYYVYDTKTDIFRRFSRTNSNYKEINAASQDYTKIMDLFSQSIAKFGNEYLLFLDEQLRKFKKNNNQNNNLTGSNQNSNNLNDNQNTVIVNLKPVNANFDENVVINKIESFKEEIKNLVEPYALGDNALDFNDVPIFNANLSKARIKLLSIGKNIFISISNDKSKIVYLDNNKNINIKDKYSTEIANSSLKKQYLQFMINFIQKDKDDYIKFLTLKLPEVQNNLLGNNYTNDQRLSNANLNNGFDILKYGAFDKKLSDFLGDFNEIINKANILLKGKTNLILPESNNANNPIKFKHSKLDFKNIDLSKIFDLDNYEFNNKTLLKRIKISKYGQLLIDTLKGATYTYLPTKKSFVADMNGTKMEITPEYSKLFYEVVSLFKKELLSKLDVLNTLLNVMDQIVYEIELTMTSDNTKVPEPKVR